MRLVSQRLGTGLGDNDQNLYAHVLAWHEKMATGVGHNLTPWGENGPIFVPSIVEVLEEDVRSTVICAKMDKSKLI